MDLKVNYGKYYPVILINSGSKIEILNSDDEE